MFLIAEDRLLKFRANFEVVGKLDHSVHSFPKSWDVTGLIREALP
jgi:hypothetical protein